MGNSLLLTLPELILTLGSLVLLMVAAFAGDRSARLVRSAAPKPKPAPAAEGAHH